MRTKSWRKSEKGKKVEEGHEGGGGREGDRLLLVDRHPRRGRRHAGGDKVR